jgi:hypothetical protein
VPISRGLPNIWSWIDYWTIYEKDVAASRSETSHGSTALLAYQITTYIFLAALPENIVPSMLSKERLNFTFQRRGLIGSYFYLL